MPNLLSILAALGLALGASEGFAYWWMHPAPAGATDPVLVYRPGGGVGRSQIGDSGSQIADRGSEIGDDPQPSTSSRTPLPEVVDKALPTLHCTTGTAARLDYGDGTTIHLAFFEWDLSNSTSVLEAFKHLPDECMGSIGMKLTGHSAPRSHRVGKETLTFDHTLFRDPRNVVVHAFKGTWVSGANSLIGDGERGVVDQWRQIRWKSALKRFSPAHARVAQGAVRGISDPDLAWQAFESAMLTDLKFQ